MKHYIICKYNETVTDKESIYEEAKALFSQLVGSEGIKKVEVFKNCTEISNRYDLMIVIDMDKSSLSYYNESSVHKFWKENYSKFLASKAIFDHE